MASKSGRSGSNVGNIVRLRAVSSGGAMSVSTTSSNSASSSPSAATAAASVLAAGQLNGQFYVINSPQRMIAPRLPFSVDTSSSGGSPAAVRSLSLPSSSRDDRRRATHNEVERRRRDNINTWIMKLGRLIPAEEASGPSRTTSLSKGGILARACDYITELEERLVQLDVKDSKDLLAMENSRLKQKLEDLKQENAVLRQQLDSVTKHMSNDQCIESILS